MAPRRLRALAALVAYVATAIGYPALHAEEHARAGAAGHVHVGLATVFVHAAAAAAPTVADHHADFDADLAALELGDVAAAGTATVDCALAAFTLAACDADAPPPAHPHTFGDELLARLHRHGHGAAGVPDLRHGAGSLAHLAASLLTPAPLPLPPRADLAVCFRLAAPVAAATRAPAVTHAPRGPPARAA